MKRNELTVGMTVEDKGGREYVVVDTEGWIKHDHQRRVTGRSHNGHPIVADCYQVTTGKVLANGVLVVRQNTVAYAAEGETLLGEVKQLRQLFPVGHQLAAFQAKQAELEASVESDEKRDANLLDQVRRYWGDVPHLIETCGVHPDGGLLTDREVQILVTMILCGQNRDKNEEAIWPPWR